MLCFVEFLKFHTKIVKSTIEDNNIKLFAINTNEDKGTTLNRKAWGARA